MADEGLIQTFLIADIRGYTSFSQEHGDEAAGRLAARFAEVTTQVIEAGGGTVLELRGDEALCIFSTTRRAIRSAIELQARFLAETNSDPTMPLPVGIGIDTGEAVPVAGGFRGRALNLAARLCGSARAGEILATREALHIAGRMDDIHVEDRGLSSFKNIPEPVGVMRISRVGDDPARWFAEHAPPPALAKRSSTRRRLGIAALATVLVAAVAIPLISTRGSASTSIAPNSVGVLDPQTGEVTATIGFPTRPGSVAASADAVWVTNPDVGTVTRIDPSKQEVRDSIQVGENPAGIAVGEDAVWVVESGEPSVSRISPQTNEVVDTFEVGNGPAGVAVGEGSVWVTNQFDGTISRIDPDRNEVVEPISVGLDPRGIAVGFGVVWVALAGANTVVRVDPETNSVTQSIGVGNAPGSLAVSADAVWVVNTLDDTVSRINPDTNSVVDTVGVGEGPSEIAVVQGIVWVANEADGTLSRIEPGQTSIRKVVIGSVPQGLAGVNGELWVSVRGTATSHRGGTLRTLSQDKISTLDPTVANDFVSVRLLHLIGDGLVGFKSVGGTDGATLVPDLAASIPMPTDGDRAYAFELRSGIRYSNGEVVAPADFRRAIERGFRLNTYNADLYGALVGGKACANEPRTCDLSRGIVTDDVTGMITFHLVHPDPVFLFKLTLQFAYPVPPSVPDEEQVTAGVPGTGPYMLEAPMTLDGLALVRNPHFHVWSPAAQPDGYVDRIEWTSGVEPQAQVEAVAAGDADLSLDAAASERLEEIFVQFAAQVHASPEPTTYFVVLNTEVPPFDDVDVRRAVNFAVDRERVAQILGGDGAALPTCQQLPPNFPGYEPYCPYTADPGPDASGSWTVRDLEKAKRLVRRSGTAGMRVTFEYPPFFWKSQGRALGDYMVGLLKELGYHGSVRSLTPEAFYSSRNKFQMALDGLGASYPAASDLFISVFTCNASILPSPRFCDPRIDAMINRATKMQADDPAAAGALWAEIDRVIVKKAPYLWLVNPVAVEFVSERVGNYQWSLQSGSLLNQLWVR
jgi:YVTN family beta-propeller protein